MNAPPPAPPLPRHGGLKYCVPGLNSILTARKVITVPFHGIGWHCLFNILAQAFQPYVSEISRRCNNTHSRQYLREKRSIWLFPFRRGGEGEAAFAPLLIS